MHRWWNLSKLVTNTLVNFGNFFNYIILSPLFLLTKRYFQKMLFGRNAQFPSVQRRIQTTSTYASAEVTSAVVKLLKNYRNTRFLLQIMLFFSSANQKDWNLFGQGMSWLFCKICRMSLHACHAVKTVFLEISENSVRFKKIFKNALIIPRLFFKCLQNSAKYTGWTDYRLCGTAIVFNSPSLKYMSF